MAPSVTKGKVLAAVSLDIDNQTRNPQTPDIGCDEFVLANTASWVGKVSTDWTLPDNWEANTVPNSTTDDHRRRLQFPANHQHHSGCSQPHSSFTGYTTGVDRNGFYCRCMVI